MSKGANAVSFVIGEAQDTLWLEFDIDAVVQLEDLLDQDVLLIAARLGNSKRLGFLRALLWAGLQKHHPAFDLVAAGELLRQRGGFVIADKIVEAFRKAFPNPEAGDKAEPGPPTPPAE